MFRHVSLAHSLALAAGLVAALVSQPADACGCFAPTTTVTPVVQAGERILFAVDNGTVTAHIQIQYSGDARSFGWLLPLPSVPTLKAGTDELFDRLLAETDPIYVTQGNVKCRSLTLGCAASAPLAGRSVIDQNADAGTGPAVKVGSVGPYEFAVLSAADKTEMIKWLNDNRFFIPAGTETAVDPYIAPGSYFLALKLRSDRDAGDITPVVLEYAASYPMIPLVLTSVGALPNMGVQVWLLGEGRGIPRNFAHVVLNDSVLDWERGVSNYAQTVTRAVGEAPNKHAFITEYAGPSTPLKLDRARFGTQGQLASSATLSEFLIALKVRRFGVDDPLPPQLVAVIAHELPVPDPLAARGITERAWVEQLDVWLGSYRDQHPEDFVGYTATFDATSLAAKVFEDYVTPIQQAFGLFDRWPKLTRLFTTLSPEDMTADPVFAFNAALPDVDRTHRGTQDFGCGTPEVTTEQGWIYKTDQDRSTLPAALSIASVPEEGAPTILTNNIPAIGKKVRVAENSPLTSQLGCSVDPLTMVSVAAVWAFSRRRRRR
ncbi:MAG: DUF2330 domain-containing protein [Myxococcaceae bacterium]